MQWIANSRRTSWLLAIFLLAGFSGAGSAAEEPAGDVIRVEVRGKIRHGIVAIGGETTGTTITAKGATWELDLQGKEDFVEFAEKHSGKTIVVNGTLEVRQGLEVPKRWIVTVTKLSLPPQ